MDKSYYIHFTSAEDAAAIVASKRLLSCSYVTGVYAVMEGGTYVPGTQQSSMGRAANRDYAVVFETEETPTVTYPEEVIFHPASGYLPITEAVVITASEAVALLSGKIPEPD